MSTLVEVNIWDQQPGESAKAFEAFRVFRDMGLKRSMAAAFHRLSGKDAGKGRLSVWSQQHDWANRVIAYDRWVDQRSVNEKFVAIKEMSERHAKMAVIFLNKVVTRLQSIDPETLTPDQLLRWFEVASRVERVARGEPSETVETTHTVEVKQKIDLSRLNDDEFNTIRAIFVRRFNDSGHLRRGNEEKGEVIDAVCEGLLPPVQSGVGA